MRGRLTVRRLARLLAPVLAAGALLALAAPVASAHPLGNFTVNRYTGLLVGPEGVQVDHVIDLAEIPTAQLGARTEDLDGLADEECERAAARLLVRADGAAVPLSLTAAAAVSAPGEADLPVTRITCGLEGDADLASVGDLELEDTTAPGTVGWREVVAVGDEMTLATTDVPSTSISDRLTSYPEDLLSSPPDVTTAAISLSAGGPPGSLPGLTQAGDEAGGRQIGEGLSATATRLLERGGLLAGLLGVLVAMLLGASHALAPGHGKTVMAFYLSQRGDSSWRAALSVGATVTLAHTGSVLVLGLLVSVSSSFVPAQVYPWLTLATGLLILGLGLSLLRNARRSGHGHGHGMVTGTATATGTVTATVTVMVTGTDTSPRATPRRRAPPLVSPPPPRPSPTRRPTTTTSTRPRRPRAAPACG